MFDKIKNNKGVKKLQEIWDENPLLVIGVGIGVLTATAKIVDAVSAAKSRRAYANMAHVRVTERRYR